MINDLPDDWYEEHDGQRLVLNSEKVAAEITRLRLAFLTYLQNENECAKRGRLCGPGDTCGCKLEMEDYINATTTAGQKT